MLRTIGFAEKMHGGAQQRTGLPDISAVVDGCAVWLEVKAPGKKPTVIQVYVLNEIRDAGGWAAVVTSHQDLEDLVAYGPREVCRRCLQHGCGESC